MINLQTPFKYDEELKRTKVPSISERLENLCREQGEEGRLKEFCSKKFVPSQTNEPLAGSWKAR